MGENEGKLFEPRRLKSEQFLSSVTKLTWRGREFFSSAVSVNNHA